MSCRLLLAVGLCAVVQAQRSGYGGNSYEDELMRRQYEFQQQQRLRQMQAQQQAQQQGQGYTAQQQQQQRLAQQAAQRAQQEAVLAQMQREALLRQQGMSGGMNGASGFGQKPMSNKEKKKLQKEQEAAAKKKKKDAEARLKAFKAQQAKARGGRAAVSERKGPLRMLFSIKGLALTGTMGYLYFAQRELLMSIGGILFKYPILLATWLGRTILNVVLKPILLRVIALKSGGGSGASDVLPGGAY